MGIRSLALRFVSADAGQLPGPGRCYVYVESGNRFEPDRGVALTPLCVSARELEEQVNRLKVELDEIVTEARSEYGRRTA